MIYWYHSAGAYFFDHSVYSEAEGLYRWSKK